MTWTASELTTVLTGEIDTDSATAMGSPTWSIANASDKVLTSFKVYQLVKAERNTRKHAVEMLSKFEQAIMIQAVISINTNTANRGFDLLLDKDITRLEAEEIGQKLRTSAWIDSLICTAATTCLTES